MWLGEELSQAAVNRQILFNSMKQRLWEEKQNKKILHWLYFFKKGGGSGRKGWQLSLKSEPSTKKPIVGYCALCNSQSLKKRDLNLLCVFLLHSGTEDHPQAVSTKPKWAPQWGTCSLKDFGFSVGARITAPLISEWCYSLKAAQGMSLTTLLRTYGATFHHPADLQENTGPPNTQLRNKPRKTHYSSPGFTRSLLFIHLYC